MDTKNDPNINTLTVLGLAVVIPVLILLLTWGVMPAEMPVSKNLFTTGE